jgi:hypothetical protein
VDLRTLKQIERAHMNKWDITFVDFVNSDPGKCIAAGLDREVGISTWEATRAKVRS